MNSAALSRTTSSLARPLKVLVPLIKDELDAGDAAGLEHYRKAGEMLLEARDQVTKGEWISWVERNFELSERTARRYMKLAAMRQAPASRGREHEHKRTLSEVVDPPRNSHQPTWHQPVQQIVNRVDVEALAVDRQNQKKERDLERDLALQLIDIGYKVLVKTLHPDKGGSREAMQRLNRVRDLLKQAI
jgi:hypothetical protein